MDTVDRPVMARNGLEMTRIRKIRFHRFGDNEVLQLDEVEQSVEPDGDELSGIGALIAARKVRPHVEKSFPLEQAMAALASVEPGHPAGKVVLAVS
jgi:NADPH:quinone reductase-like Zn-dependent oxidoreductase